MHRWFVAPVVGAVAAVAYCLVPTWLLVTIFLFPVLVLLYLVGPELWAFHVSASRWQQEVFSSEAGRAVSQLRSGLLQRAVAVARQRAQEAHAVAGPRAVGADKRSVVLQEQLAEVLGLFCRDYVDYWYGYLSSDDPNLSVQVKQALWILLDALQQRLNDLGKISTLVTRDIPVLLCAHIQAVGQHPPARFPSHPCLISRETELHYLRQVAEALLLLLVPPECVESGLLRATLVEVLAVDTFMYTIDTICDFDYINQYVLHFCKQAEEQREARPDNVYKYAKDYASFFKLITTCDDVELLKDIRYHVIAEIMQATSVQQMKELQQTDPVAYTALRIANNSKESQLRSRNLPRYINQCKQAKHACEQRIKQLGGPQYGTSTPADQAPANEESTSQRGRPRSLSSSVPQLDEVLRDGLALGYFMQYLKDQGGCKNLNFWLACESLKQDLHEGAPICKGRLTNIIEVCQSRSDAYHIQVDETCWRDIQEFAVQWGISGGPRRNSAASDRQELEVGIESLTCFMRAQNQVFRYLNTRHYRQFVLSDFYRKYVRHAGRYQERAHAGATDHNKSADAADSGSSSPSKATLAFGTETSDQTLARLQHELKVLSKQIRFSTAEGKDVTAEAERADALKSQIEVQEYHLRTTEEWCQQLGNWEVIVDTVEPDPSARDSLAYLLQVHARDAAAAQGVSSGWVVSRTHVELGVLHKHLRECCDWLPVNLPVPAISKGWFRRSTAGAPTDSQTGRLRTAVQEYLQAVLDDDILCQSEKLYAFLSPSIAPGMGQEKPDHPPMRRTESATDSFISSLTTKLKSKIFSSDDARIEEENDIAEPLYMLISEIFELKGLLSWFRRQLVAFVQLTYGGTLNRHLSEVVAWMCSTEQLCYCLTIFKDSMFPENWVPPPPRTTQQVEEDQVLARAKLIKNLPDTLITLVGQATAQRGAMKLLSTVQNTHMNKHLFYLLFETFLVTFFPEFQSRDLAKCLVVLNAGEQQWLPEAASALDGQSDSSELQGASSFESGLTAVLEAVADQAEPE